jgi:two-component system, NtrC family, response regulator PilR
MIPNDVRDSHAAFAALRERLAKLIRPIKVLVVEDDPNDIKLIENAISKHRAEMKIALTSSEAKQWLTQYEYDLCLLDLKLPDEPGTEVLKWAQENKIPVPFAVLTGIDDRDPSIQAALDAGAVGVFRKPLSPENVQMILGAVKQ